MKITGIKDVKEVLLEGIYECRCTNAIWEKLMPLGRLYLSLTWSYYVGKIEVASIKEKKYFMPQAFSFIKTWSRTVMNVPITTDSINERLYIGRFATVSVSKRKHKDTYLFDVISSISKDNCDKNNKVDSSFEAKNITTDDIKEIV